MASQQLVFRNIQELNALRPEDYRKLLTADIQFDVISQVAQLQDVEVLEFLPSKALVGLPEETLRKLKPGAARRIRHNFMKVKLEDIRRSYRTIMKLQRLLKTHKKKSLTVPYHDIDPVTGVESRGAEEITSDRLKIELDLTERMLENVLADYDRLNRKGATSSVREGAGGIQQLFNLRPEVIDFLAANQAVFGNVKYVPRHITSSSKAKAEEENRVLVGVLPARGFQFTQQGNSGELASNVPLISREALPQLVNERITDNSVLIPLMTIYAKMRLRRPTTQTDMQFIPANILKRQTPSNVYDLFADVEGPNASTFPFIALLSGLSAAQARGQSRATLQQAFSNAFTAMVQNRINKINADSNASANAKAKAVAKAQESLNFSPQVVVLQKFNTLFGLLRASDERIDPKSPSNYRGANGSPLTRIEEAQIEKHVASMTNNALNETVPGLRAPKKTPRKKAYKPKRVPRTPRNVGAAVGQGAGGGNPGGLSQAGLANALSAASFQ